MSKYAIVIEKGENNYSAYLRDVPGCIATGKTIDEIRQRLTEALTDHFELMREAGEPIPPASTIADYVEVT